MKGFKVIIPSFNSVDFLTKTLQSVAMQTDPHFQVCVIDDASTIPRQREIIEEFCSRYSWKAQFHDKNRGALYGMVRAIHDFHCDDEDVIVILDGDDWFSGPEVLAKLRKIYDQENVFITWGQCEVHPAGPTPMKYAQPVPEMVVDQKLYRQIPFVFWHLGTFKYALWKHLADADLRDLNGEYFMIMKDKATLWPMLEMAGSKIRFVEDTLVIYNLSNPLNDYANTPPEEHQRVDALIRSRSKYPTLDICK